MYTHTNTHAHTHTHTRGETAFDWQVLEVELPSGRLPYGMLARLPSSPDYFSNDQGIKRLLQRPKYQQDTDSRLSAAKDAPFQGVTHEFLELFQRQPAARQLASRMALSSARERASPRAQGGGARLHDSCRAEITRGLSEASSGVTDPPRDLNPSPNWQWPMDSLQSQPVEIPKTGKGQ